MPRGLWLLAVPPPRQRAPPPWQRPSWPRSRWRSERPSAARVYASVRRRCAARHARTATRTQHACSRWRRVLSGVLDAAVQQHAPQPSCGHTMGSVERRKAAAVVCKTMRDAAEMHLFHWGDLLPVSCCAECSAHIHACARQVEYWEGLDPAHRAAMHAQHKATKAGHCRAAWHAPCAGAV